VVCPPGRSTHLLRIGRTLVIRLTQVVVGLPAHKATLSATWRSGELLRTTE
jgi:hypothetical protein